MKAIQVIYDADKLNTAITNFGKTNRVEERVQELAVSALVHRLPEELGGHGDNRFFGRLIDVMPKGTNVKALKQWILEFGGVLANGKDKNGNTRYKNDKEATFTEDSVEKAMVTSWATFKAEKEVKQVTVEQARKRLTTSIEGYMEQLMELHDNEASEEFIGRLNTMLDILNPKQKVLKVAA